jgi:biotin synthase
LHPEQGPQAHIETDNALLAKANAIQDKSTKQFFDAAAL